MANVFENMVTKLTVETAYTPPLILDNPFAPGPPSPVLKALKPRITLELMNGTVDPVIIEPYGPPVPNHWGMVQIFMAAGVFGLGYMIVNMITKK